MMGRSRTICADQRRIAQRARRDAERDQQPPRDGPPTLAHGEHVEALAATPSQVATILRSVMLAREPITARRIDLLTGYGLTLVLLVLTDLHAAGDVEIADCGDRHSGWRVSNRWRYDD